MSELRWLLLAAGLAVLALVFWWTRRETSGKPILPPALLRRQAPSLNPTEEASPDDENTPAPAPPVSQPAGNPQRIITVRLTGQGSASFAGDALLLALTEAGLQHGRFGIFHRVAANNPDLTLFSVASLVEPGTFDPAAMAAHRFPGVSFFLMLPASCNQVAAFDDMMSTARAMAAQLDGQLLDEQGSRLSVQRERFLREEVIQFQHKAGSG